MRVKEILKEKGMTHKELAQLLGITTVGLSQLLAGKPSYTTMEKFANALGVEIWELFVSAQDVAGHNPSPPPFIAMVRSGEFYREAHSLEELKAIVKELDR